MSDMRKFKHLDSIANTLFDKLLKLPLTTLETQYVINEISRYNLRVTNSKIKKIKNSRIEELEEIADKFRKGVREWK